MKKTQIKNILNIKEILAKNPFKIISLKVFADLLNGARNLQESILKISLQIKTTSFLDQHADLFSTVKNNTDKLVVNLEASSKVLKRIQKDKTEVIDKKYDHLFEKYLEALKFGSANNRSKEFSGALADLQLQSSKFIEYLQKLNEKTKEVLEILHSAKDLTTTDIDEKFALFNSTAKEVNKMVLDGPIGASINLLNTINTYYEKFYSICIDTSLKDVCSKIKEINGLIEKFHKKAKEKCSKEAIKEFDEIFTSHDGKVGDWATKFSVKDKICLQTMVRLHNLKADLSQGKKLAKDSVSSYDRSIILTLMNICALVEDNIIKLKEETNKLLRQNNLSQIRGGFYWLGLNNYFGNIAIFITIVFLIFLIIAFVVWMQKKESSEPYSISIENNVSDDQVW